MDKEAKEIRVLFKFSSNSTWMGGVNYFRNLFHAISMVEDPKIISYIDYNGDFYSLYSEFTKNPVLKRKKGIKYIIGLFLNFFFHTNYNLDDIKSKKYIEFDITSHCQKIDNKPNIQWIPDFQHNYLPQMFTEKEIKERNKQFFKIAKKSDIVLVSSNDALKDFKKFFSKYGNKGRTLHFVSYQDSNIYSKTDLLYPILKEKFKLPDKYFFLPNQFWKHKNHKVVLDSLIILSKKGLSDITVICTGNTSDYRNPDYFSSLSNYIKQNKIEKNIKILGFVEYEEMICLLRYSVALLQPSLFEGWSSTIEEAKSIGKNCILSNLPVHIEQNPPDSVFFNPNNAEELAVIMEQVNNNYSGGPNYKLEELAKLHMNERMLKFGKEYKDIILNLLNEKE